MLEIVLKFVNKVGFIREKFILFAAFFVIAGFYGCDVCDLGQGENNDSNDIFFTAISLNGSKPGIFAVSPDGNRLREIINDAVLYSGPSQDKSLIFLREILGADTVLFTINTDGSDTNQSSITATYDKIELPIISPDGKYFSIYVGSGQLIIIANKIFAQWATYNFYEGTEPSFSPDGKYLAFYEKMGSTGPMFIKVVNTDNPRIVIYQQSFDRLLNPISGNATIDWSSDSRYITYEVSDSEATSDIINIDEIQGSDDNKIVVNGIGAFMPSLSPDKSAVTFASRDGNIWVRTIADGRSFKMTDADTTIEYNLYPQWTNNGKEIFYTKYYRDDTGRFSGTLEIVNYSSKRKLVLSNNVLRGYKMRIKA